MEKWRKHVYRRDRDRCIACEYLFGRVSDDQLTLQHRVSRGMGGSARYDETPAGLIAFCAGHNLAETAEAKFAGQCRDFGWSVPRWVVDRGWSLEMVPVRYADGWFALENLERVPLSEDLALDRMLEIYGPDF